jgi:probable DNA metabolism protein
MIFIYDASYEGLLSCIFEIFQKKTPPTAISTEDKCQLTLLDPVTRVATNEGYAKRVLKAIDERTNSRASNLVYKIFLSELPESELLVYQLICAIIQKADASIIENYANPFILQAVKIEKMINREVHRMHAFVRFQKTRDNLFYAAIEPDFNVLPLIGEHFERRYADQAWLIFDTKRHYGLYYDQRTMSFVSMDDPILTMAVEKFENNAFQDERENEYQRLWKNYFQAVNIRERNNPKLHLRHMPKRYWKYLVEKSPG